MTDNNNNSEINGRVKLIYLTLDPDTVEHKLFRFVGISFNKEFLISESDWVYNPGDDTSKIPEFKKPENIADNIIPKNVFKDKHNIIIYEDVYKYLVYPKPEDEDEFNDEVEDDEIDMDMMEEFASLPGEVQRTIKSAVLPKYDRKKPEQSGNMLIFVVKAAVDNK